MADRIKITKRTVDALPLGKSISDAEVIGFRARRLPSGRVVFESRYGGAERKFVVLGHYGSITPEQARTLAKKTAGEVASGRDPSAEREAKRAAETNTIDRVLDEFLARYVRGSKPPLRSAAQIEDTFLRCVRPRIGEKSIYSLRRGDIVGMLDKIADEHGAVMADRALAYVRKAFNWWATRDDGFNSPIVKGMARTKPKERARRRTLDDNEIRDLWTALDALGEDAPACYPAFLKALLLTGQRRSEVSRMRWEEIEGDRWVIPAQRAKNGLENEVQLTTPALALLGKARESGFVFSSDGGKTAFSGYSKAKGALDRKLAALRKAERRQPMPGFVQHDLRRTARSLMSRAGVPSDHAERVLGHVIGGVRGVYDRHEYQAEKRDALEKLAALVDRILNPTGEPVVAFPKQRRARDASA
jgi:integrase